MFSFLTEATSISTTDEPVSGNLEQQYREILT